MINIEEIPLTQIRIILKLWDRPKHLGFAENRSEGGSIKDLKAKGIVQAQGRIGRRVRWQLVEGRIRKQEVDKMRELVKLTPLSLKDEALIIDLLDKTKELWTLLAESIGSKGSIYFLEHLFLGLRQMGYYFTEESSPLFAYGESLSDAERDMITRIINIRDAIGHRESSNNFLTPSMKIIGGQIYKDGDLEIQYGQNRLYLLGEVLVIYKKFRELFSSVSELGSLSRSFSWRSDEEKLNQEEIILREKLKYPEKLLMEKKLQYGDV